MHLRAILVATVWCWFLPVSVWAQSAVRDDFNYNYNFASATTIATGGTVAVTSGDLIIACACSKTADFVSSISDGTNTLTNVASFTDGITTCRMGYILSASTTGSLTITATYTTAVVERAIHAAVYHYTGSATFGGHGGSANNGNSTSLATGNISPSGSDLLVLACGSSDQTTDFTTSSTQINGSASTWENVDGRGSAFWGRAFTSGFTGTATATVPSGNWIAQAVYFSFSGGGSGPEVGSAALRGVGR